MRLNQQDPTKELYKPIFEHLKENYEVELVSTDDGDKIDGTYRTLIVPGGGDFSRRDVFEIDQYFMHGGNLIVLVDAVKVSFQYGVSGSAQDTKLLGLLEHYGARVEKSMVVDASCGQVQIPQQIGMFRMNVARDYPFFVAITPEGLNSENPAVATLGGLIMPWVSPITLMVDKPDAGGDTTAATVQAEVMVRSSPKSWVVNEPFNLNPTQQWQIPAEGLKQHNLIVHLWGDFTSYFAGKEVPPVKEQEEGDTVSQIQLSADNQDREIKAGNTDRHLIVAGDADFLSAPNATPGNTTLLLNVVDWLTLDENLIGIRTRTMVNRSIQQDRLGDDSALPSVIRWTNILTMPVLLVIVGLVIFFRRKEPASVPVPDKAEEKKA
jgi:ABC-type uncharacterized transport system involved in gliding motility auxiliary subunit